MDRQVDGDTKCWAAPKSLAGRFGKGNAAE